MNVYSEKLNHGASEVLEYYDRNKVKFNNEERRWLYLSRKMKEAALLKENTHAEKAIQAIARLVVDEFPLTEEFCPSFSAVLDAVQRAEKKRKKLHG
jgi:hypothetical protein